MELGEQAGVYILHFTAGNDRPGFLGEKWPCASADQEAPKESQKWKEKEGRKNKIKKIEFSALAVRPTVGFMREGGQRDNKKYTSVQLAKRRMGHIPVPVPYMMLSIRMWEEKIIKM